MGKEDDIKKIEHEIDSADRRIEKEIKTEESHISADEKKLRSEKDRLEEIKSKEAELEGLKRAAKASNGKLTEIEIEISFAPVKQALNVLYYFLIQKKILFYLLLILAVVIGLVIRTASLPALGATPLIGNSYLGMGGSLTGLDPYIFYVEMQHVINTGNVPPIEHLEYLPIGMPTRSDELLISFFGAWMFGIMHPIIPAATPMTWFMLYPPLVSIFSTVLIFLIILALFRDYWAATLGAFIFPAFQTFLSRSAAGFSTKTAMGYMFILLSIYFLIKTVKSKNPKTKIMYGFMLALSTGITASSSGYAQYVVLLVPIVYIMMILMDYAEKSDMYAFLPFGLFLAVQGSFMTSVTLKNLTTNPLYFPMYLAYVMILFKLLVFDKRARKLKIPLLNRGFSALIYSVLIMLALVAVVGIKHLVHLLTKVYTEAANPLGVGTFNPVTQTIAEYGHMTLAQRICDYGFLTGACGGINTIGLNFLLFTIGGIFVLYFVLKRFRHWYVPFLLILPFIVLLTGGDYTTGAGSTAFLLIFIFGSMIPMLHWFVHKKEPGAKRTLSPILVMTLVSLVLIVSFFVSNQTTNYYKYGAFGAVVVFALTFAFDRFNEEKTLRQALLIPMAFFLITLFLSNVENRLLEPTELAAALLIPFVVVMMARELIGFSKTLLRGSRTNFLLVAAVIVAAIAIFVVLDLYSSLTSSYIIAQQSGSGLAMWGPTLQWVNQNTPLNSTLISWWDYGYWEEAIANRTTVADGSNAYGYQSMIAKYFFTATSPYQYSTYLNFVHRPTYAVISGSEIEKFSAISTIALNYTQFTPMAEQQSVINQNKIGGNFKYLAVFGGTGGGIGPLEANMVINGVPWNGSDTLIIEILIPFNSSNSSVIEGAPYGLIYNELTRQLSNPLPLQTYCIYSRGCTTLSDNASAIPGAIMMLNASNTAMLHIGGYNNTPNGTGYITAPVSLKAYGNAQSLLFMPKKSLNTLFTKLYLLNETVPGFQLVFTDNLPVDSLLSINNQVLTNINVYKINYTALEQYNLLTKQCSTDIKATNYCANLSYLPAVFENNSAKISSTPII